MHIRPKKGTYVSHIDLKLVEEVRHLRSIVETELAVMACDLLTEEDLDVLRENIAIWKMYMERKQTDKILQYDKEFHRHFYGDVRPELLVYASGEPVAAFLTARRC